MILWSLNLNTPSGPTPSNPGAGRGNVWGNVWGTVWGDVWGRIASAIGTDGAGPIIGRFSTNKIIGRFR